jgi:DNA-binding transcriptional LysR family regulator
MVWVVRTGHPLAALGSGFTLEALAGVEHVAMDYPKPEIAPPEERRLRRRTALEDRGAFDRELDLKGLTRRVGAVAPDSFTALAIVARTDMAALVPRRLAERAVERGVLQQLEPPYESPPLEIGVLYMRDRSGDPALMWLLELLAQSSQGL